jgi:hypothetical protein
MNSIEVINYDEMPDGSAVVTLELPPEAVAGLIQQGFNKILGEYLNEIGSTECDSCSCNTECREND